MALSKNRKQIHSLLVNAVYMYILLYTRVSVTVYIPNKMYTQRRLTQLCSCNKSCVRRRYVYILLLTKHNGMFSMKIVYIPILRESDSQGEKKKTRTKCNLYQLDFSTAP